MVELHFLVRTLLGIKGESAEWYEPKEMGGYKGDVLGKSLSQRERVPRSGG
jgi:hypothetical protein